MIVFFYLEASQPGGVKNRLGLVCSMHPRLASMVVMLF